MGVKLCQVTTRMRCRFCDKENHIFGGYEGKRAIYHCARCQKDWEYGPEVCSIRQIPIPYGKCINVFNGAWLQEEIELVGACAFKHCEREHDEWGWYKGRHFYTAWRLCDHGRVVMGRNLVSLVEKVAELCKPKIL